MPVEVEPPELARLLEYDERPRVGDWSMRAALICVAQAQPQLVSDVLDVVRRIDFTMGSQRAALESEGPALWRAAQTDDPTSDRLVGLLRAMVQLDRLGDLLAAWADDPDGRRPDEELATVTASVTRQLDQLGIPHEERRPPRRGGN